MEIRELNEVEVAQVSGGNPVAVFIAGAIVGGAIYDAAKVGASWFGSTFLASDGSGGSRYPVSQMPQNNYQQPTVN